MTATELIPGYCFSADAMFGAFFDLLTFHLFQAESPCRFFSCVSPSTFAGSFSALRACLYLFFPCRPLWPLLVSGFLERQSILLPPIDQKLYSLITSIFMPAFQSLLSMLQCSDLSGLIGGTQRTSNQWRTIKKGHMQPVVIYDPLCSFLRGETVKINKVRFDQRFA